ncbi:AAA family ATPase [Serratia sp. MF1(2023)]|uniref:AAA family ATPase n=1 Tax=unclassified Serratia (in: enterobacteria) TaxID=2647522 RepID=UPI0035ABDD30
MLLKAFRINHYRSIHSEIKLDTLKGLSIVGPNNCGKTNILKGIKTFFQQKMMIAHIVTKGIYHLVAKEDSLVSLPHSNLRKTIL